MRVFVIHRSASRRNAVCAIRRVAKSNGLSLSVSMLDSSRPNEWQRDARKNIEACEAVIVYNQAECKASSNAVWEIELARQLGRPIILFDHPAPTQEAIEQLHALYDNNAEFESKFALKGERRVRARQAANVGSDLKEVIELYKIMVASSEQLVQRRQSVNAFFIAAIGGLVALAGAATRFGQSIPIALISAEVWPLTIAGLLLCRSWSNLIENYGKLNRAKFRVILKMEDYLSAKVYAAEWVALGKGLRPRKYKSFTATEKHLPLSFALLIFALFVFTQYLYFFGGAPTRHAATVARAPVLVSHGRFRKYPKISPTVSPNSDDKSLTVKQED